MCKNFSSQKLKQVFPHSGIFRLDFAAGFVRKFSKKLNLKIQLNFALLSK